MRCSSFLTALVAVLACVVSPTGVGAVHADQVGSSTGTSSSLGGSRAHTLNPKPLNPQP